LGELKLALREPSSIHGSREDDVCRSLTKNAKEYFYAAQAAHSDAKKQCDFINKKFELTKDQLKFLQDAKKKLKTEQHEQIAQNEIDIYVHQLDACSLHMALMVAKGIHIFQS